MHLTLVERFERALGEILARVRVSGGGDEPMRAIAVAYSGGLDSSVLLHLLRDYVAGTDVRLFAFHIHHGISPNADTWLSHCERESRRLGVHFDSRRVRLDGRDRTGVEEAARLARYAALGELCRTHSVPLLLTAHHLDDQAETVLLQLLRGSGVAGLSGMEPVNAAEGLLGADVHVGRPLLGATRDELERYVVTLQIDHIHDESNADPRYARNALRTHIMPALASWFPGFQERIARSAQHARSAEAVLMEVARRDLADCSDGDGIDVARLRMLTRERIDNLLRYWFHTHGLRMPSTAWLDELRMQALVADDDAQVCVCYPKHPDCRVRRYRNRLSIDRAPAIATSSTASVTFRWNGEPCIDFAAFGGRLHFDATAPGAAGAEEGIDPQWLREQPLVLRVRQGGERLKLAADRPTRTLKQHYQALAIPAWQRERLPLLFAGDDLLHAAGIGTDCRFLSPETAPKIRLRWCADIG